MATPHYTPTPEKIEEMKKKIWEENIANQKPPRNGTPKKRNKYHNCMVSHCIGYPTTSDSNLPPRKDDHV